MTKRAAAAATTRHAVESIRRLADGLAPPLVRVHRPLERFGRWARDYGLLHAARGVKTTLIATSAVVGLMVLLRFGGLSARHLGLPFGVWLVITAGVVHIMFRRYWRMIDDGLALLVRHTGVDRLRPLSENDLYEPEPPALAEVPPAEAAQTEADDADEDASIDAVSDSVDADGDDAPATGLVADDWTLDAEPPPPPPPPKVAVRHTWPRTLLVSLLCEAGGFIVAGGFMALVWTQNALRRLVTGVDTYEPTADRVAGIFAARAIVPSRSLRVLTNMGATTLAALSEASAGDDRAAEVAWMQRRPRHLTLGVVRFFAADAAACRFRDGTVEVIFAERERHDSAWFDWARPLPLTASSVFPQRVDASRVTIPARDDTEPVALRALLEYGAAEARSASRLTLEDLCRGRSPSARQAAVRRALATVADPRCHQHDPAWRALARAATAAAFSPGLAIDPEEALPAMTRAAQALHDEIEPLLRLGACQLAAGLDDEGLLTLREAFDTIGEENLELLVPPDAFVQEEHVARGDEFSVGRVAGALTLAAATLTRTQLEFLAADFVEDAQSSRWLVGAGPDLLLLRRLLDAVKSWRDELGDQAIGHLRRAA